MPAPIFPIAPYLAVWNYTGPFGTHKMTTYYGNLVVTATGDLSGFDYGYGASAGQGWQTKQNDIAAGFLKFFHATTTLNTITLYHNPSPGITPPIPIYTEAAGGSGNAVAIDVESSEATLEWADALNNKMKLVMMDTAAVPPLKQAIPTAGGTSGAAFRLAILTEQLVTTRNGNIITRAVSESIKYNRRFMRKRGQ